MVIAATHFLVAPVLAAETKSSHITVIINQVRGKECCDLGQLSAVQQQVQFLNTEQLSATFALRYDAVIDKDFQTYFKQVASPNLEVAALLEITPKLASQSGVLYTDNTDSWYQAEHAFLIGYQPDDRKKLIDTYMAASQNAFGDYPTTTVSWMIDPLSLAYLQQKYGVSVQEITREQWGTDSYTIYGGPPHYPYKPSQNWAIVPDPQSNLPLILRQTITDPVHTYGDLTSSYTSQPNDYRLRHVGIEYFAHLFSQAHQQPTENETFALIGLENTMPQVDQEAFGQQLGIVAKWRNADKSNAVMTASAYQKWWSKQQHVAVTVYAGEDSSTNKAWWITTPKYRVRLRQEQNSLFISDIRIYDTGFTDPYLDKTAIKSGYWIMPFIIDGSRFLARDYSFKFMAANPDNLANRKNNYLPPTRLELDNNLQGDVSMARQNDCITVTAKTQLASFCPNSFDLPTNSTLKQQNGYLDPVIHSTSSAISWITASAKDLVSLIKDTHTDMTTYTPTSNPEELTLERSLHYPLLLPELLARKIDNSRSLIYVDNQFALAGRNPVRIVFYPKDAFGYPVLFEKPLQVTSKPETNITIEKQHQDQGYFFIDLKDNTPQKVTVKVQSGDFSYTKDIFFVADCKHSFWQCLKSPIQFVWYVQNVIGDSTRKQQAQIQ